MRSFGEDVPVMPVGYRIMKRWYLKKSNQVGTFQPRSLTAWKRPRGRSTRAQLGMGSALREIPDDHETESPVLLGDGGDVGKAPQDGKAGEH